MATNFMVSTYKHARDFPSLTIQILVLDLPQLYTKPAGAEILQALELLKTKPRTFSIDADDVGPNGRWRQTPATPQYLTSIISSSLSWLESDDLREAVWDAASARLSERSGRAGGFNLDYFDAFDPCSFLSPLNTSILIDLSIAMPAMSRKFTIPSSSGEFTLTLHEPSLTADNLGMKTWVSSYLLSRRLHSLVPSREDRTIRALELGAGTGLVGLSFAVLHGHCATTHLTDLPATVENLAHNVTLNLGLLKQTGATVTTDVLDWSITPEHDYHPEEEERLYDIVLAADSLYSPKHPEWLVNTVARSLRNDPDARFVIELPLRDAYLPQIHELRERMGRAGLVMVEDGEEVGYDDWESADGRAIEVGCWWSAWKWR